MKKHLGAFLRVLVSVGILAYLFNGIFHKEALEYFQAHNIDPGALDWVARARIVWSVGPQALWHEFQKINPIWLAAAIVSAGTGHPRNHPLAVDSACPGVGCEILAPLFDFVHRFVFQRVYARLHRRRCRQGVVRGP